jgi:hypothetical protein
MNRWKSLVVATVLALVAGAGQSFAQTTAPPPATVNPVPAPTATTFSTPPPTNSLAAPPAATSSNEDIHDIRGPIAIPYEWLWAAYIFLALLVATAAYFVWKFIRKYARAKAKLPYEIALDRLEAARSLMTVETVREYAFTVSEVIRVYIEQRFGEKAARRTTEEFLSDLLNQKAPALVEHQALLEDFLNHCDLMKFARWGASIREMESMHESARAFILDTRPQPESAKPARVEPPAVAQPELVQAK